MHDICVRAEDTSRPGPNSNLIMAGEEDVVGPSDTRIDGIRGARVYKREAGDKENQSGFY